MALCGTTIDGGSKSWHFLIHTPQKVYLGMATAGQKGKGKMLMAEKRKKRKRKESAKKEKGLTVKME